MESRRVFKERCANVSAQLLPVVRGRVLRWALLWLGPVQLFLWKSLLLPYKPIVSCPVTYASSMFCVILCFQSPGAASVVVGHPLDTIKVKHFEPCSHVLTTQNPTDGEVASL